MTGLVQVKKILPATQDERGTISDIIIGKQIQHVGIITSKAESLRGSHYHKLSTQYNYILKGEIELTVRDARDPNSKKSVIILNERDFVEIPPLVIHALKAIKDSVFLVFTSEARIGQDYEMDTYRIQL